MKDDQLTQILNQVAVSRYVNLCFIEPDKATPVIIHQLAAHFRQTGQDSICVKMDIQMLVECQNEEEEAAVIVEMVNAGLTESPGKAKIHQAISVSHVLEQLNDRLEKPSLIIFHHFQDIFHEREKDILRSIRKYINMIEDALKERLLGILLVSRDRVDRWELFPESNLDERHIAFQEYKI